MTPDEAIGEIEQLLARLAMEELDKDSVVHLFRKRAEKCRAEAWTFNGNIDDTGGPMVALMNAANCDSLADELEGMSEASAREGAMNALLAGRENEMV